MKSKIQSIVSPGPAMKLSSDIALFTTTLPFPLLVSLTLFLIPFYHLLHSRHLEAAPPIELHVPGCVRLQVRQLAGRIGAPQRFLHQLPSDTLALKLGLNAYQLEVPVP